MIADGPETLAKASPGKLAILYDGGTGEMCGASMAGIRHFDPFEEMGASTPESPAIPRGARKFSRSSSSKKNLLEELHAVDDSGRVYPRRARYRRNAARQRGPTGWLAYLWYLPGFPSAGRLAVQADGCDALRARPAQQAQGLAQFAVKPGRAISAQAF